MATIEIKNKELTIRLHGMDKLMAFRSKLTIPLDHIREVMVRPPDAYGKGPVVAYKIAGAYLPDVISAGLFWASRGLANSPKHALERLERSRQAIQELDADSDGHRDQALELVAQAMSELRAGAEKEDVSPDDEGSGWAFYTVHDPDKTIGLTLQHEKIRHVVIEIDDMTPEEAVQMIIDAKSAGATYRTPG